MKKSRIIFVSVIVVVAMVASLQIQRRTRAKLGANNALLRQQQDQLAELATENHHLSNQVVQTKTDGVAPRDDRTAELAQLRAKVEALREQTNQLAKQLADNRRLAGAQFFFRGDFDLLDHNQESTITFAGGPRANGKLNDARALSAALRKYADEHQGEFPSSLDQITGYLPKPLDADSPGWANAPLSGTNDFEIVYQGSQHDLIDIPLRRVALIRERQPWPTPAGRWARVYGYADGAASPVESDDNFQSWDAQHIIPPPNALH